MRESRVLVRSDSDLDLSESEFQAYMAEHVGEVVRYSVYAVDTPEGPMKWADMFGSAPDFTGGQPVDEFLDASRGEA